MGLQDVWERALKNYRTDSERIQYNAIESLLNRPAVPLEAKKPIPKAKKKCFKIGNRVSMIGEEFIEALKEED